MAEWFTGESRVRVFLGLLILVLVLVNSQSLQLSQQSRNLLASSFEEILQSRTERIASAVQRLVEGRVETSARPSLSRELEELSRDWKLRSLCLLDWNGRMWAGSEGCRTAEVRSFDRLDREGKRALVEDGWAATKPSPAYDPLLASAFGYTVVRGTGGGSDTVVRIEVPASELAQANRHFRSALIYQVSALTLVLVTLVLFLNRLLAPHRRLMAEARSVAGRVGAPQRSDDENQFLLATFQGVVERLKDKERELEQMHRREKERADETQALATDIVRSMTTGLVSLDESAAVVMVNPAAEAIFRVEPGSVRGKPFSEVFPGSSELADWIDRAVSRGESTLRRRVEYRHADGVSIHLGVSVIPLRGSDGGVRGALCLHADLTEVVRLRERLLLKGNLARLGEMAAGIAHELRNGLATILGNAKLLKKSASPAEAADLTDALVEESLVLNRVVTEFLQFAKPESVRLASVDVARLVEELSAELEPRAEEAGVRILVAGSSCRAEVDELLVKQALQNLVLNAVEAASSRSDGSVEVHTEEEDGYVLIRVRDNGPGVAEEDLKRIFTPFFTTKAGGTGLGLALVQKIAVAHNGEVLVGRGAEGASFTLKLPLVAEPAPPPAEWV